MGTESQRLLCVRKASIATPDGRHGFKTVTALRWNFNAKPQGCQVAYKQECQNFILTSENEIFALLKSLVTHNNWQINGLGCFF